MRKVFVRVGYRKLKGIIIGEENERYIVKLEDNSRVIVKRDQIEGEIRND